MRAALSGVRLLESPDGRKLASKRLSEGFRNHLLFRVCIARTPVTWWARGDSNSGPPACEADTQPPYLLISLHLSFLGRHLVGRTHLK